MLKAIIKNKFGPDLLNFCINNNSKHFDEVTVDKSLDTLRQDDWVVEIDSNIILPDNFRHSFFAHYLDNNRIYSAPKLVVSLHEFDQWAREELKHILPTEKPEEQEFKVYNSSGTGSSSGVLNVEIVKLGMSGNDTFPYLNIFYNYAHHRDFVFRLCLEEFRDKSSPVKILEIGTSRTPTMEGKKGDGWSSMFWCDYLQKNGGQLIVCDVDKEAIETSKKITKCLRNDINVDFLCQDGSELIDSSFDLIFLDGSDCPIQMLQQFEKIDRTKTKILCDDFHVKGTIVREKHKDFKLIQVNDEHEMAIYERIDK
tara:strand:- start:16081 stop:17016 length:936 start_codon:yes stop_codon:yes gene_type:complete